MKSNFLLAAGVIILVPAVAAAAQPAQAPPSPAATQAQAPAAQPNDACDETGKPAGKSVSPKGSAADGGSAAASSSESVKSVQRDTGDRPAPAKKSKSQDEAACPTQSK
jgi:hypothetical protein